MAQSTQVAAPSLRVKPPRPRDGEGHAARDASVMRLLSHVDTSSLNE